MDPPTEIADGLATSVSDFDAKVDKYVSKRVNGDQFNGETAETLAYTGDIKASDLADFFPDETVLDIGLKQKDRGGSLDSIRLWVLVGAKDGSKKIFELKQWAPSGTAFFEKQDEPFVWAESVYKTFRKGVDASDYRLVTVGKSGLFWLRQKKVNIVKVDYNGKAPESKDFAHRLGIYDSWYLGTLHGSQVGGDLYLAKIQEDPAKFKDAVKGLAKDYLEKALAALNASR